MGTQVVKATLVRVMNRTKYIASDTILRQVEAEPTEITTDYHLFEACHTESDAH